MKVSQELQDFKPVTITLETFDELRDMMILLNSTNSPFPNELWDAIRPIYHANRPQTP